MVSKWLQSYSAGPSLTSYVRGIYPITASALGRIWYHARVSVFIRRLKYTKEYRKAVAAAQRPKKSASVLRRRRIAVLRGRD